MEGMRDVTTARSTVRPARAYARFDAAALARGAGWTALGVGLLLAGFVVYELFITSFFAGRAQAGLTEDLYERIAVAETPTVAYEPASLGLLATPIDLVDDVALPSPAAVAAALESSAGHAAAVEALAPAGGTAAQLVQPTVPAGTIVTEPPAVSGEALGRIEIPSIGVDWTVVEGVSRSDLRRGAGHMPDTALPGQPGNAVISGHRTTYGAPFHDLGEASKGDLITITTASGSHVYQIVRKEVVLPNETWVTGQWEGSWLTLTTCHPKFSSRERLVVFARLVGGPNAPTLGGRK